MIQIGGIGKLRTATRTSNRIDKNVRENRKGFKT